ncbi:MAG: hypothetical protein OEW04_12810 [Nitrospirota bacterium]|nr:hypothetical protein [Nitrospirota bacterium]
MKRVAETFIKDLPEDSPVLKLLKEIAEVTHFPLAPHLEDKHSMVIHYLKDYRSRRPISKESLEAIPFSDTWLLKKRISKLHDTDIYWLCNDIARMKNTGVEKIAGKTLYVFLDQYLKDDKTKKKKKAPSFSFSGYPLV